MCELFLQLNKIFTTGGDKGNEQIGYAGRPIARIGAYNAGRTRSVPRTGALLTLVCSSAVQRNAQRSRHRTTTACRQQGPHHGQLLHFLPHL